MGWTRDRLAAVLTRLGSHRVCYHSEADFQHALAWEIRTYDPEAAVRLEVPMRDPVGELDILLGASHWADRVGVELKYARGHLEVDVDGERFSLKGNDPKDVARYAFWSDVRRLERWVESGSLTAGFAVLLANDPSCWTPGSRSTNDDRFRLHDGAVVAGTLDWLRPPKQFNPGAPITLSVAYACRWADFGTVPEARFGAFRVLVVEVRRPADVSKE